VRGDGRCAGSAEVTGPGSPPRAWGRLLVLAGVQHARRFTPTCVGTAPAWAPAPPTCSGSPPRAWGRRADTPEPLPGSRFTPTCVGTARGKPLTLASSPVHPHVRGDGAPEPPVRISCAGSPPRAWGRRYALPCHPTTARFTPTCVGTANQVTVVSQGWAVHPHVRGDGARVAGHREALTGSPPRAWGRLRGSGGVVGRGRFTPTCVGTARPTSRHARSKSVHPHVRGDGDRHEAGLHERAVHPHVRGDGSSAANVGRWSTGSPPRAWGRLLWRRCRRGTIRFTPTCVGTAPPSGVV